MGSPTYQLSKYLANLLKHLCLQNVCTINNGKEFAEFVCSQKLDHDETIVSFDVVSLFTSIPVPLAPNVVKRKLSENDVWRSYTNLKDKQVVELLDFVLSNSYFKFEDTYFHQISGCAMGSPVSAVIAEIVMQEIESIALDSSPCPVRWWRRYVDDSNSCLRKQDVQKFHSHLNSINTNIQFTIEMPSTSEQGHAISFLDTNIIFTDDGDIEVDVHRKSTHTNKYLSFHSHNPIQSKRNVVKTLIDRANTVPSTDDRKQLEKDRIIQDLKLNDYPEKFISDTCRPRNKPPHNDSEMTRGVTCIPYIKGISEQIKRTLSNVGVRTAYKSTESLGDIFGKPKDKRNVFETKGIVYKFQCPDCTFTYVGQSKRNWKSRWAEHKPGVRSGIKSSIKDHVECSGHNASINNVNILEKNIDSLNKRTFFESLYSIMDNRSVNEHQDFPTIYIPLVESCDRVNNI